jgi:hypothetical protein
MPSRIVRSVLALETEEQILNIGALTAIVGMFLPWISGEWLGGDAVTYTGFNFFTSYLGLVSFLLLVFLLCITFVPLAGGPVIVRKRHRETVRLCLVSASTLLVLAALSVLMKVSFEFQRLEMRFGIYVTLIGCLVALIYAILRFQEYRKSIAQELFRHPEDQRPQHEQKESFAAPPPPPPPPPPAPEEHRLYP